MTNPLGTPAGTPKIVWQVSALCLAAAGLLFLADSRVWVWPALFGFVCWLGGRALSV